MDDYPVEAMRSSQITLAEKLGIIISTQYPNDDNVFLTEVDIAKKTLDGVLENTRYFSLLYEPDDELKQGDIWMKDDRCIYQSNPVTINNQMMFDDLKKKRAIAVLYPSKRENYLCKHNNIQYKGIGTEGYIDIQKVKLCSEDFPASFWRGKRVWVGMDLSQSDDNTAIAWLTEENGCIYAQVKVFIPGEDAVIQLKSNREKVNYEALIESGEVIPCGAEVIDYGSVERFIINTLQNKMGCEIAQVGYDRYNAISTVQKLESAGIECVEVKQHSSVLHMPTKLLKELILDKAFKYSKSKILEINFQNARCVEDTNLNKYVSKKKSAGKVDAVFAILDALYCLQQEQLFGSSVIVQY